MTRKNFRQSVFNRDGNRCVICFDHGDVAHHIMERRLFPDGGYRKSNGATVCSMCHWKCEDTSISPDEVREAAGITKIVLPPHLYSDQKYTKWGDPVLPSGMRLKGELFEDKSVRWVIRDYLYLYVDKIKYPRTYHLPWSENITDDDRIMTNPAQYFEDKEILMTEKMDGENTTLYWDGIHARSVDGRSHPTQDWVKNFHSQLAHDIPQGWRVCGENLWATHAIKYKDLYSYFLGFSIWNDKNECLSWEDTLEWFGLLGIEPVKDIYIGKYDIDEINFNWKRYKVTHSRDPEGYIIRNADSFHYKDFRYNVAKYVRKDFAAGQKHWFYGARIERNSIVN